MNLTPKYFFNNSFDDTFDFPILRNNNLMKADITKEDNNYKFEIDIPGFKKEDINIEYNKGYLIVKVKKEEKKDEETSKQYVRRERFFGEYQRNFYVGDIDESKIIASYENGILNVIVPAESENQKANKSIAIQ